MSCVENVCLSASLPVNQNSAIFKTICYKIKHFFKVMTNLHFWQIQCLNSLVVKLLQSREHAENYTKFCFIYSSCITQRLKLRFNYTAIILQAF